MQKIIVEPHYLGSLEYYGQIVASDEIHLEVCQNFTKQTYKNRCYILSANGIMPLTVPVKFDNRTPLKDVTIDHSQSWARDHKGAFYSAYGKAPFFEFFQDYFNVIWEKKHPFLIDLNLEMMTMCLKVLQIDRSIQLTEQYEKIPDHRLNDLRERILPKKTFEERNLYLPFPYTQTFGNIFVPNLSIIDLIMCEGSRASEVLTRSMH